MPNYFEINLTGFDALSKRIEEVTFDVKYKGGRYALRKAAHVIAEDASARARKFDSPKTSRSVAGNVAVRWNQRRFKKTGDLAFRVGVLGGAVIEKRNPDTGGGGATPHWRLLEFGTVKMESRPHMRPSFHAKGQAAIEEFRVRYEQALDRAIKRRK